MMIIKVSFKCVCSLNKYFWFASKRSLQDPVPFKQEIVLIKLIKLYRSANFLGLLLSGLKIKISYYNLLFIRNTINGNNLRWPVEKVSCILSRRFIN